MCTTTNKVTFVGHRPMEDKRMQTKKHFFVSFGLSSVDQVVLTEVKTNYNNFRRLGSQRK
jgi:hypothetical protein